MSCELRFLAEVADDASMARAWYEAKVVGLGDDFLAVFYAAAERLVDDALIYSQVYRELRRCVLPRFPYAV